MYDTMRAPNARAKSARLPCASCHPIRPHPRRLRATSAPNLQVANKLPLIAPAKLSKPLIKKGDDGASASIIAAFAATPKFQVLVLDELELAAGRHAAAKRCADEFLLAAPNPTYDEVVTSLSATADKYAKLLALPPTPPLTKALLKKGGAPAVAAVLAAVAKSADFAELAHLEMAADVAALKETHLAFHYEDAGAAAAKAAAKRMAASFFLALPTPTEDECKVSLGASLDVLTRL